MKAAVRLVLCVLLLEQVHLLAASDDDEDLFAKFFPESKDKPGNRTTTHVVSRHAYWPLGPGIVVTTKCPPGYEKGHKGCTKHPPEVSLAPEEEKPIKGKGKGKKGKKKKGSRSRKEGGHPTATSTSPAPTKPPPGLDFEAPKRKYSEADDNGDVVY